MAAVLGGDLHAELQGRGRRNIRNWQALFPGGENGFAGRDGIEAAERRVREIVERWRGSDCRKVIGGWEIVLPPER